jgi:hypothetical protein
MIRVSLGVLNSYSDLLAVSKSALPLAIALPYAARYVVPFSFILQCSSSTEDQHNIMR